MKKTEVGAIVRQGDMVFMKVAGTDLTNSKKADKIVVGLGEVSGHSHEVDALEGTEVLEYAEKSEGFGDATRDRIVFEVKGPKGAIVTHEEHNPITLDEGMWVRINQINYDPFRDELEKVRD